MREISAPELSALYNPPYRRLAPIPCFFSALLLFLIGLCSRASAEPTKAPVISQAVQENATVSARPKALPHPIEKETYYKYCTRCHGPGKMNPFPPSHTGYGSKTCLSCHGIASEAPREASFKPAAKRTRTGASPSRSSEGSAAKAKTAVANRIPHSIEGENFKDCLNCHAQEKMKPFPASHAGYSVQMCTSCHKP